MEFRLAPAAIGARLPANDEVQAAAELFRGEVEQTPPPFSAKKVDGKPAYKAARRGETVVLKPVSLMIEEFVIGPLEGEYAEFTIRISSGGYVRSVAHDLGQILGCGAHLARLRRVAAGPFTLGQALTLEELSAQAAPEPWSKACLTRGRCCRNCPPPRPIFGLPAA